MTSCSIFVEVTGKKAAGIFEDMGVRTIETVSRGGKSWAAEPPPAMLSCMPAGIE